MSYYNEKELHSLGFKKLGNNVNISEKCSIYNATNISIGNDVRIDDFCILSAGSGGIFIGNYVHIACYVSIIGNGKVVLDDFSGLSGRVSIYSSSDNYDGEYMTNPCLPSHVTNTYSGDVTIGRHVVVGAGSVILPNVTLGDGCSVGAMCLVNKSFDNFTMIVGVPARKLKDRKRNILYLEKTI